MTTWSQQVVSTIIVIGIVPLVGWYGKRILRRRNRRRELDQWILEARKERDKKQFSFLEWEDTTQQSNDDLNNDTTMYFPSAAETVQLIQRKQLDLLQHLANLAHRCHRYGLGRNSSNSSGKVEGQPSGVNAITHELYDLAQQQAEELLEDKQGERGVLFGVPISVKDRFAIGGQLQTGGMACRLKVPAKQDGVVMHLLKKAGAIPFVRSNAVQTLMMSETTNRIWGTTRNPWNLLRGTGGSGGGDAALVSMQCIPLGIGSDVAGSIRIPASACGVVGYKPTSSRISGLGNMNCRLNDRNGSQLVIPSVMGPLSNNVDDCALFMEAVCIPAMWKADITVVPMPFNQNIYKETATNHRLTIGYFMTDSWWEPCTAVKRAIQETIDGLEQRGHTVVEFPPPTDGWFNYDLLCKINMAEGSMRSYVEALEGEPMIPEYNTFRVATSLPDSLRWILRHLLDKRKSFILGSCRRNGISVYDFWQLLADLIEMRTKWSNAMIEAGIDVLIFPSVPLPAMPHGIPGQLAAPLSYMFIANLLQWPAGSVPVTTVQDDEQHYYCNNRNNASNDLPKDQRDGYAKMAHDVVMSTSAGMPISVQVMARHFADETCLGVMKQVEDIAQFTAQPTAYLDENGIQA